MSDHHQIVEEAARDREFHANCIAIQIIERPALLAAIAAYSPTDAEYFQRHIDAHKRATSALNAAAEASRRELHRLCLCDAADCPLCQIDASEAPGADILCAQGDGIVDLLIAFSEREGA